MLEIELRAMGSQVIASVDSEEPAVRHELGKLPQWFAEWERRLSRFDPESELSRLNAAGRAENISSTLLEVLAAALDAADDSGGLVTPTVLEALERAGYDRSFELLGDADAGQPSASPTACVAASSVRLDRGRRAAFLSDGARLDLGGFAKGWSADEAARRLGRLAPALVDVGGDLAVSGPRRDGSPWPVAVADPHNPERMLGVVQISRGGVATSGRDHRRWGRDGNAHHIIDPRTGQPAESDVLTATVLAPSASRAEVAAKVLLILGSRAGLDWIEARPGLSGLYVRRDEDGLHGLES